MKINLHEMLTGRTSQLRNIVRYSNGPRHHDESVAEHSYYTALYTLLMCEASNADGGTPKLDVNLAVRKAVLHDLDECISGDFVRSFKMSRPGLCEAIESAAFAQLPEIFFALTSHDASASARLAEEAQFGKDHDTLEGSVVAFADFLSVLSYAIQEVDSGNDAIVRHLVGLTKYLESFEKRLLFSYPAPQGWYAEAAKLLSKLDDKHIVLGARWK